MNPLHGLWICCSVRFLVLGLEDSDYLARRVARKVRARTALCDQLGVDAFGDGRLDLIDDGRELLLRRLRLSTWYEARRRVLPRRKGFGGRSAGSS